jgi:hypothetical protein
MKPFADARSKSDLWGWPLLGANRAFTQISRQHKQ